MSGRKASEVSSLLNRANKARNVFDENLDNELEKFSNNIEQYEKQYTENESIILMEVSQEALKELSYEIELLNKEKEKLMKVKKRNYSSEEYKKIKKDLYFQIKKNDDQSKRIFSIIRGKSHYCDEEYRQAEVIYKNAKKIEEEKTKLEIKIKNENSELLRDINKLKQNYLRKKEINEKVKKLNEKSKKIVEVRKEANSIKDYIFSKIEEIDSKIAEKFLKKEYFEIIKIKERMNNLSNEEIISNSKKYEKEVLDYTDKLEILYKEYLDKKNESETKLQDINSRLAEKLLYKPMEYYKSESKASKITFMEFLKEFGNNEYVNEIQEEVSRLEKALTNEEFDYILSNTSLNTVIEKAISYSKLKFEQQIKTIDVTFGIRKVMRNLGYQVEARMIDGDIDNGFRVIAKIGDEIIDFDKVVTNENGSVNIDIDHTESRKGNCGTTWRELQDKFTDEGIMIQDITKNSKSVLYNSTNIQSNKENQKIKL